MFRTPTPARIAIGGFQHETNTFAPYTAPFEEFVKTDSWPGLTQGDPIAAETLVVAAAGVSSCQLAKLTYKHLRPGVRLEPSGFTAKAKSDQM